MKRASYTVFSIPVFLMMLFLAITIPSSAQELSGRYDIGFSVGGNTIPGSLEMVNLNEIHRGRMTIRIPNSTINVALRESGRTDAQLIFSSSSPVQDASIQFDSNTGKIQGAIVMTGNQTFSFTGEKKSEKVAGPVKDQLSRNDHVLGADSLGFAFPTLSPNGQMLVFIAYRKDFSHQQIMYSTLEHGEWSTAKTLPFSGRYSDRSPAFSPKGDLYFASRRPSKGEEAEIDNYDLWRVKYKGDNRWGKPKRLKGVNSTANEYQPSPTQTGLFFTSDREGGLGGQDIYYAEGKKNKYQEPANLGEPVNSKLDEISAFVSYDEKTMLLSTANFEWKPLGNDDLYVFKKRNGVWTMTRRLGEKVNSFANEYGAGLSPDGRWLWFTSDVNPWAKIYKVKWE